LSLNDLGLLSAQVFGAQQCAEQDGEEGAEGIRRSAGARLDEGALPGVDDEAGRVMPLTDAPKGYERMMAGEARFRVVLDVTA
jgi:hypothetical protein